MHSRARTTEKRLDVSCDPQLWERAEVTRTRRAGAFHGSARRSCGTKRTRYAYMYDCLTHWRTARARYGEIRFEILVVIDRAREGNHLVAATRRSILRTVPMNEINEDMALRRPPLLESHADDISATERDLWDAQQQGIIFIGMPNSIELSQLHHLILRNR